MAAPVPNYIRLPDDSSYAGASVKKVRAEHQTVGSDDVYSHFFCVDRPVRLLGTYDAALSQATVSATAQDGVSATQAFLWAHVPTAVSGRNARIRRVLFTSTHQSVLLATSAPRLRIDRFTFTGAATSTQVAPSPINTAKSRPVLDLRTNSTGLAVTLAGGSLGAAAICGVVSAVSATAPQQMVANDPLGETDEEDEWIVLAPGEGVVIYQDVAGTGSETRRLNIGLVWDEIDVS